MAVSVAALVKRRAKLDAQIREAEQREKDAVQLRKDTERATFIVGGLMLSQDIIPDTLRSLLVDHAARRHLSDQGVWEVIAARWKIELPNLAPVPASPPSAAAASPPAVLETSNVG